MQKMFTQTFHVPGALAADLGIRQKMASNCSLVEVSAVVSGAPQAGLTIGDGTTADLHMAKKSVGASGAPAVFGYDDFKDGYPHLKKGDLLALAVDYDYNNGGAGSASADLTVVLTFTEG